MVKGWAGGIISITLKVLLKVLRVSHLRIRCGREK